MQHDTSHFLQCSVLSFNNSILLWSQRSWKFIKNSFILIELIKCRVLKLSSMIISNTSYSIVLFFLKLKTQWWKHFKHIWFFSNKSHQSVSWKVIYNYKGIFLSPKTFNLHRIHQIHVKKFKNTTYSALSNRLVACFNLFSSRTFYTKYFKKYSIEVFLKQLLPQ